jgi:hypothetical protein
MSSLVACPQHPQLAVTMGQAERSARPCFQDRVAAATEQAGLPIDERPFEEHRRTQKRRLSGESWLLLAYVFWHWKRTEIAAEDYDSRQRAFHAALAAAPPSGLLGSFSVNLSHAPWVAGGSDGYEDWYLVQDFAALGLLNEAAVSASRAAPHDAVAALAAGGAGACMLCGAGQCCASHSTPIGSTNPKVWLIAHCSLS